MPDFITVSFYTRTYDDIYDSERLHRFLTSLSEQGHYLAGSDEDLIFGALFVAYSRSDSEETCTRAQAVDSQSFFVPTVTPALWQDVEAFMQHNTHELSVTVYSTDKTGPFVGFTCGLMFNAHESQIYLFMEDNKPDIEDFQHYIDVAQLVYSVWHPLYGYQDDPTGSVTSLEQARHLDITWLYSINLFGPEIVEHLGRDRVLSTPAWLLKTLDDSGVLIVPELYRGGGRHEEYQATLEEAAQHLSLIYELPEEEE